MSSNIFEQLANLSSKLQTMADWTSYLGGETGDIIVCMPSRGWVCSETISALMNNMDGHKVTLLTVNRKSVVDARNELFAKLQKMARSLGPRRVIIWCDDDIWWGKGTIARMIAILDQYPQIDVIAGMIGDRRPFSSAYALRVALDLSSTLSPGVDCSFGDIVEVEDVAGAFLMHRMELVNQLPRDPWSQIEAQSEDWNFCARLRERGKKIAVLVSQRWAHIDVRDGIAYMPFQQPGVIVEENFLLKGPQFHLVGSQLKSTEQREYGFEKPVIKQ